MLLMLVGANVALLMFARAAARESEIVVRTALGATRGRIIMQLFAEALVLGECCRCRWTRRGSVPPEMVAGGIRDRRGRAAAVLVRRQLAPETMFYAACLTVLSAASPAWCLRSR